MAGMRGRVLGRSGGGEENESAAVKAWGFMAIESRLGGRLDLVPSTHLLTR